MFIKPAPGIKVRDPISKIHLRESGEEKPESSYWVRRLNSGDVVFAEPPVVHTNQIPDSSESVAQDQEP